jgi:hypothetical protein
VIRGATVEKIGAAHTDLMVAGCAAPFSIVGLSGSRSTFPHNRQKGGTYDAIDYTRLFLVDSLLCVCISGARAEPRRAPTE